MLKFYIKNTTIYYVVIELHNKNEKKRGLKKMTKNVYIHKKQEVVIVVQDKLESVSCGARIEDLIIVDNYPYCIISKKDYEIMGLEDKGIETLLSSNDYNNRGYYWYSRVSKAC